MAEDNEEHRVGSIGAAHSPDGFGFAQHIGNVQVCADLALRDIADGVHGSLLKFDHL
jgi:hypothetical protein